MDTKLERWVAIKTVRAGAGMADFWNVDLVRSLVQEAAMVARFNHPYVVAVHMDAAYIVMEPARRAICSRLAWLPIAA